MADMIVKTDPLGLHNLGEGQAAAQFLELVSEHLGDIERHQEAPKGLFATNKNRLTSKISMVVELSYDLEHQNHEITFRIDRKGPARKAAAGHLRLRGGRLFIDSDGEQLSFTVAAPNPQHQKVE